MRRLLHAAGLGLFLTLTLGLLARPAPILGAGGVRLHPPAALLDMKQGTAQQPFVRRQLVPFTLRTADRILPVAWREAAAKRLEANRVIRPFLFAAGEGESFDSFLCLILWFLCFTIYAAAFEAETAYYAAVPGAGSLLIPSFPFWFTLSSCLLLLPLLHNNYIYDPPTLCFSVLTLRSIRRERLLALTVLTVLFSLNRETAFIVPGLTFFAWLHRGRIGIALQQAALLSVLYLAIAGGLVLRYRHNPGSVAQNNRMYLVHTYLHKNADYALTAMLLSALYAYAVRRCWKRLPPTLKAVQWFVPPWIAMHILWGWPMEWRVFFEIYPGMMLTIVAMGAIWKSSSATTA